MPLSPVALFVFNRPQHAERTLESLIANTELAESLLCVFCDGPRHPGEQEKVEATREVVKRLVPPGTTIIERETNWGLARSIQSGVSYLCERHGRAIVVEDDLVLAPTFLRYMNDALDRYQDDERVMQVSGHMFPVAVPSAEDAFFMPFTTSWGWATWERAWRKYDPDARRYSDVRDDRNVRRAFDLDGAYPYFRMLERQQRGEVDSWAIRWYLSVFWERGLTLFPVKTLVQNRGFDGSGTHCGPERILQEGSLMGASIQRFPLPQVDREAFFRVQQYLRTETSVGRRLVRKLNAYFGTQ